MPNGLIFCTEWNPKCIAKLIETLISCLLILIILAQILLDVRMRGVCQFGLTQTIQVLMVLTLLCNVGFLIDYDLPWFYYMECFFYDCYFCTLVFYITFRMLQKSQSNKSLFAIKIVYGIIILGFFAIFIYSGLTSVLDCKQTWFLAIDIVGLIICIAMIFLGYKHHKKQSQIFLQFRNQQQINNPLGRIWTLILINLFSQIIELVQNLVFAIRSQQEEGCHFSTNQTIDTVIKLIFSIFSQHLSFFCTLVMFILKRRREINYSKASSNVTVIDESPGIEMVDKSNLTPAHPPLII